MNAIAPFQPLIMPTDRILRQPISRWQENLCRELVQTLSQPNPVIGDIAPCMNQLALLEAYQGHNLQSLQLCEAQIQFWQAWAANSGEQKHLCLTVQPWINIIRLDRWQNRVDRATSLYTELAPHLRDEDNSLRQRFGIDYSFTQLCEMDPQNLRVSLLDNVYWMEYGRQLLACGEHAMLQAHIQAGLKQPLSNFLKLVLLELLFIYQYKLGNFEKTIALISKLDIAEQGSFWLPVKVLEMALHLRLGSSRSDSLKAEVLDAVVSGRYFKRDAQSLYLMFELSRVLHDLDLPTHELPLLDMTFELAQALNDEVILFEVMHRQAALQQIPATSLLQRFRHSRYGVVQRKLGIDTPADAPHQLRRAEAIVSATRHMAELNFETCIGILQQEFADAELSAA